MSNNQLKMLACCLMAVDHAALIFLPKESAIYWAMRLVGRIAFPIFLFCLTEGFLHTRSRKKQSFLLFIFACVSEGPFDIAFGYRWEQQNVLWTLLICYLMIWGIELFAARLPFQIAIVIMACLVAYFTRVDYRMAGILACLLGYLGRRDKRVAGSLIPIPLLAQGSAVSVGTLLSTGILWLYSGKRGAVKMKYFFYVFYPMHLLLLAAIKYGCGFGQM